MNLMLVPFVDGDVRKTNGQDFIFWFVTRPPGVTMLRAEQLLTYMASLDEPT